jgi:hypothetical protein
MGETVKGQRIDGRLGTAHRRTAKHHICRMECNHVLIFYSLMHCPQVGERAWCVRCEDYCYVLISPSGIAVPQFYARCRRKGCKFSRRTGADRAEAERAADGHAFRSNHTVDVFPDETTLEPLSTFAPQAETLDLGDIAI